MEVRQERGNEVCIIVVGNKNDLGDKRRVSMEQGEKRAKELGVLFIETSAKTGHNVKQLFRRVAASLPGLDTAKEEEKPSEVHSLIQPQLDPEPDGSCSC